MASVEQCGTRPKLEMRGGACNLWLNIDTYRFLALNFNPKFYHAIGLIQ